MYDVACALKNSSSVSIGAPADVVWMNVGENNRVNIFRLYPGSLQAFDKLTIDPSHPFSPSCVNDDGVFTRLDAQRIYLECFFGPVRYLESAVMNDHALETT